MMLAADKALQSATEAGKQETGKASDAFEEAKKKLLYYWEQVHPGWLYGIQSPITDY